MFKKLALVALPALVAGVPIALFEGKHLLGKSSAPAASDPLTVAAADPAAAPGDDPSRAATHRPHPSMDLRAVFDPGVTVDWILAQWPRVSSSMSDLRYQGYRVLLVSGTAGDDVAGVLTYYFDARQQLQRITFQGSTGDPARLVRTVATGHRMARRVSGDPRVVRYEALDAHGKTESYLDIRPAEVVSADEPHARFKIDLVIQRPKG